MKNLVLLFTGLLMGLATVSATEKTDETLKHVKSKAGEDLTTNFYNYYTQPIQFIERGIEFLIFPDGTFDFNTQVDYNHYNNDNDNGYYRSANTRNRSINTTYGAPGKRVKYTAPKSRRTIITHDANGMVRRIGNVFVNYTRSGQIKRLGTVYMKYNRKGLLSQVGGLKLKYNRTGRLIKTIGQVNFNNSNNFTPSNQETNDWNSNNGHYYYKSDDKQNKLKL